MPIVTSLYVNNVSWKSLLEGIVACLWPFFSFYFMIEKVDFRDHSFVFFSVLVSLHYVWVG